MAGMFSLQITVEGEDQLLRAFSRFGESAGDMREPLSQVGDMIPKIVGQAFAASGPGWAPLSPAYAVWKAQHYPGKSLLVRTGALKGALTGGGWTKEVGPGQLKTSFASVEYARYHQKGGGRLPQRKLLDIKPEHKTAMTKILQAYLVKQARAAGL